MSLIARYELSYTGETAEEHQLEFYDVAQALIGFERSLALTTHFAINGKIITQAPSLQGAKIVATPPEAGSWTIAAAIVTVGTAAYALGIAPRDTPLGNLVSSLYDYVIKRTLGFHVDFNRTLGAQYEEARRGGLGIVDVTPERVDSLIEKSETAIKMIHRPIVESHSANKAEIIRNVRGHRNFIGRPLDLQTYGHMQLVERSRVAPFSGRVSSYNLNTFRGRIYIEDNQRPVPFELSDEARDSQTVGAIARSLARNADSRTRDSDIDFRAIKILTRTGRVKSLIIKEVS